VYVLTNIVNLSSGEDAGHPVVDWQYEVNNGDTKLGYAEWVEHKKEG